MNYELFLFCMIVWDIEKYIVFSIRENTLSFRHEYRFFYNCKIGKHFNFKKKFLVIQ